MILIPSCGKSDRDFLPLPVYFENAEAPENKLQLFHSAFRQQNRELAASQSHRWNAERDNYKRQQGYDENRVTQEAPVLVFLLRERAVEFRLRFWRSRPGKAEGGAHLR